MRSADTDPYNTDPYRVRPSRGAHLNPNPNPNPNGGNGGMSRSWTPTGGRQPPCRYTDPYTDPYTEPYTEPYTDPYLTITPPPQADIILALDFSEENNRAVYGSVYGPVYGSVSDSRFLGGE